MLPIFIVSYSIHFSGTDFIPSFAIFIFCILYDLFMFFNYIGRDDGLTVKLKPVICYVVLLFDVTEYRHIRPQSTVALRKPQN
jgi:hypothetical protein